MDVEEVSLWMKEILEKDECLYQDDVVDYLVKSDENQLLRENSDGNLVLERKLLNFFKKLTTEDVVWVMPDRYWRFRVAEDEEGRNARG